MQGVTGELLGGFAARGYREACLAPGRNEERNLCQKREEGCGTRILPGEEGPATRQVISINKLEAGGTLQR